MGIEKVVNYVFYCWYAMHRCVCNVCQLLSIILHGVNSKCLFVCVGMYMYIYLSLCSLSVSYDAL